MQEVNDLYRGYSFGGVESQHFFEQVLDILVYDNVRVVLDMGENYLLVEKLLQVLDYFELVFDDFVEGAALHGEQSVPDQLFPLAFNDSFKAHP